MTAVFLSLCKRDCNYSKSPTYERVPFREHVFKSNVFVSPTTLA